MYAIDLFAGCGGLSKGFMDAGFDVIVGVDNDAAALNTFKLNHNGAVALNADLSKQETFDEIKRIAGGRNIDVIIVYPPCQGFSLTALETLMINEISFILLSLKWFSNIIHWHL